MEIQKKSLKKNSRDAAGKSAPEYFKIKHFSCEEIANLPYIFIDDEAVIILQIVGKVELKTKSRSS